MADETLDAPAQATAADKAPDQAAVVRRVVLAARREFVVQHHVMYGHPGVTDGIVEYNAGDRFPDVGVPEEHISHLRAAGAIKLREELEQADAIARRRQELEAENAALRDREAAMQAELEAMRAEMAAAQRALPKETSKLAK